MDIKDTTHESWYAQQLERHKGVLRAARSRKRQIPRNRMTHEKQIENHMYSWHAMRESQADLNPKGVYMKSDLIGEPYAPSAAAIRELKPILIKQLKLETNHRGSYIVLRVIVPALRCTAITSVGEDEAGDAVTVSLYQEELARRAAKRKE